MAMAMAMGNPKREPTIEAVIEELLGMSPGFLTDPRWDDYDKDGVPYWEKWKKEDSK
jgi:hypothetical protein